MASKLEWGAMVGLLAMASGCSSEDGKSKQQEDPNHPCYQQGNCTYYVELPDGGATTKEEGEDAGTLMMCGPCNG